MLVQLIQHGSKMNIIVGFLIIATLIGSEVHTSQAVDDAWSRLLAVLIMMSIVPGLAFFQTSVLLKKIQVDALSSERQRSLFRRMTLSHSAVWLSVSLAIIWAIRWQDVVRGNWGLNQWPIIDDAMIIAPLVISMVASWFVFYELQLASETGSADALPAQPSISNVSESWKTKLTVLKLRLAPRLAFVSIRFRMYFALVLIPVFFFVALRDIGNLVAGQPQHISVCIYSTGLLGMLLVFPFLLTFIWKTSPIENVELRNRLQQICETKRLNVFGIRNWKTGNQVVNAAVAGIVPHFRLILISDGLLKHFTANEIEAVVRHEAGHVKLWHMPTRLFFLVFPLIAMAINDTQRTQPQFGIESVDLSLSTLVTLAGIGIYFFFMTKWISHQMEFEADIYSIRNDVSSPPQSQQNPPICNDRASDTIDALMRLAAISPEQFEKNSFFHPSIRRRIELIKRVQKRPELANRFKNAFARRKRILGSLVFATGVCIAFFT